TPQSQPQRYEKEVNRAGGLQAAEEWHQRAQKPLKKEEQRKDRYEEPDPRRQRNTAAALGGKLVLLYVAHVACFLEKSYSGTCAQTAACCTNQSSSWAVAVRPGHFKCRSFSCGRIDILVTTT